MSVDQLEKLTHTSPSISEPQWRNSVGRNETHGRTEGGYLRSRVLKRSVLVGRHRTSVSLEDVFWNELRAIAKKSNMHLSQLISRIDAEREHCNLSSAIRMFVFQHRPSESDAQPVKE
jgi:predicted DNA-binding ribbon-helix-helix protein